MPRADPTRSDYCASRHLLRNLENAAELRRNPLVREYFAGGAGGASQRRDAAADRGALEQIRSDVRTSLARCSDHVGRCTHVALGRIHGALLRCDVDHQPLTAVAAELGLSERQLRQTGSKPDDASFEVQVLLLAEEYQALTSGERGAKMSPAQAGQEVIKRAGTRYDSLVLNGFTAAFGGQAAGVGA